MKILGNIIWLIFGGLHTAIEYFIAGLVLMITIIGIPWGKMHFRLAKLALSPFGMEVVYQRCVIQYLYYIADDILLNSLKVFDKSLAI